MMTIEGEPKFFAEKEPNSERKEAYSGTAEHLEILEKIPRLREKIAQEGIDWIRESKRSELTDEEISGLLHGFGNNFLLAKNYFDQVPIPESERELLKQPEELIHLREQYTQFIRENLKIHLTAVTPDQREELVQTKARFLEELDVNNQDYAEWIRGTKSAHHYENILYFNQSFETQETKGRIYPSIRFQDSFIHWRSGAYAMRRLSGEFSESLYRVYLNPDSKDVIDVFQGVVNKASSDNMLLTCKIQDRALELGSKYKRGDELGNMRGDAIIVYLVDEVDVQVMLDYILQKYQERPEVFSGRETNKIPCPLIPGISLGAEPEDPDESLTSHRVKFLEDMATITRMTAKAGQINETEEFRRILKEEAPSRNINPDNIAFNYR